MSAARCCIQKWHASVSARAYTRPTPISQSERDGERDPHRTFIPGVFQASPLYCICTCAMHTYREKKRLDSCTCRLHIHTSISTRIHAYPRKLYIRRRRHCETSWCLLQRINAATMRVIRRRVWDLQEERGWETSCYSWGYIREKMEREKERFIKIIRLDELKRCVHVIVRDGYGRCFGFNFYIY